MFLLGITFFALKITFCTGINIFVQEYCLVGHHRKIQIKQASNLNCKAII